MTTDEGFSAEPPQKSGMSTGIKVLIGLLGGGILLAVVCCGGILFFGQRMAGDMMVQEPAKVREMAAEIADIEIPDGWKAAFGSKVMMVSVGVVFEDENGILVMRLVQVSQAVAANPQQAEQSMQQLEMMYTATTKRSVEELKNLNTESRDIEVAGQTVEFEFATGEGSSSGKNLRRVTGEFQGKGGPAIIVIQVPADDYDDAAIEAILESIST